MARGRIQGGSFGRHGNHDIFIDERGQFYASVDGDKIAAPSLDKLKAKLASVARKTFTPPLVVLRHRRWHTDGPMHAIDVTAVTGAGNILARAHGTAHREERLDKGIDLYVYDAERLKKFATLTKERRRLEAELEKLKAEWPKVTTETAAKIHEEQKAAGPVQVSKLLDDQGDE